MKEHNLHNEETSRRRNKTSATRKKKLKREQTEPVYVMKSHEVLEHIKKRSAVAKKKVLWTRKNRAKNKSTAKIRSRRRLGPNYRSCTMKGKPVLISDFGYDNCWPDNRNYPALHEIYSVGAVDDLATNMHRDGSYWEMVAKAPF